MSEVAGAMETRVISTPADLDPGQVLGAVLAHNVRAPGGGFLARKGDVVDAELAERLRAASGELHLLVPGPDELHEDEAGRRLAVAVAGHGIAISEPVQSQYVLRARYRGLVRVNVPLLREVNALEGVSVRTRFDYQPVDAGDELAGVKVTPLLIPSRTIALAEALCAEHKPLRVEPFRPLAVGVLVLDKVDPAARAKFRSVLERKLGWFGGRLVGLVEVRDAVDAMVDPIRDLLAAGAQVIMVAGASSLDPMEPLFTALREVGATIEKHGVPVHPGSLFWIAYLGRVPLFGLSSCEMFSQKTVLDLVLPRVFAGERVARADLVELGHGGMLGREMAFRFPPYREGD